LVFDVVKAEAVDRIGEPLAGDPFVAEEEDGTLDQVHDLLLRGEQLGERAAVGHLLAPSAADIDLAAVYILLGHAEGALALAAAAAVAGGGVDRQDAVLKLRHLDRAGVLHLADLAAPALGEVEHRQTLADDAEVVEAGLDAVVRAAAHRDFELVGQGDAVVAFVEPLVDLFAEVKGVDQAVLAGRALAGDDRADQRTGAAGFEAMLV